MKASTRRGELRTRTADCEAGVADACVDLAGLLAGSGRPSEAHPVLRTSCDAGSLEACGALGHVLALLEREDNALEVWRRTCARGHLASCTEAGESLLVAGQRRAARELVESPCSHGDGRACAVLGVIAHLEGDAAGARKWLARACDLDEQTCELRLEYERGRLNSASREDLRADCDAGNPAACQTLATRPSRLAPAGDPHEQAGAHCRSRQAQLRSAPSRRLRRRGGGLLRCGRPRWPDRAGRAPDRTRPPDTGSLPPDWIQRRSR